VTLTCPGSSCPFCTGELCRVCARTESGTCTHSSSERHHGRVEEEEPASSRVPTTKVPTQPKPPLAARVVLELREHDTAEEAALFFEMLAKLIRLRRRVVVICE
jgi:hypothetical protein